MKFPRSDKKPQVIDPVLPLINIVFLLLIFVMIMSRVEGTDGYDVNPPVSSSEDPAGAREDLIILTRDGQTQVQGETLDSAALLQYAHQHKREHPNEVVKIKADAKVDATRLISLMETFRMSGVESLVLLTEKQH